MRFPQLSGLTDSLTLGGTGTCPRCRGTSRVGRNLCLGCLLSFGTSDEEDFEEADFDMALAALKVSDTRWRLGNYEILEEIGRGGMGVIYRARQRHSRRIVALKRVLGYHADSRETLARFRRETEAAASLDHPNILPIYEVGESEEGVPYFSMKYASGGSLERAGAALRAHPREIVRLMAKVTRGVQFAHQQGILHRDLKPANILLDGHGEPLVSDFGLAKWLDATSDLTRSLTIYGTPGYIAPEQAAGESAKVKAAADVYSLGAILFDLLAGRPPILGEHALAVIRQAADHPAPKLRSIVAKADRDLETICAKCLEREPAARYRAAADLAEDLERWLEGRPIVARPVLPPTKLWRWSKRNPLIASAAALVLLCAGIIFCTQIQRRHLTKTIEQAALYRRSIAVLPFLNLDTVANDNGFTAPLAEALRQRLSQSGAARVARLPEADAAEPIMPIRTAVGTLSRQAGTRTVLAGTVRRVGKDLSVSLRLLDAASGKLLLQKRAQIPASSSPLVIARLLASSLSSALDGADPVDESLRDPALRNQGSAEYLRAADEFESRRGKSDLDHALEATERALAAEPRSALARSRFVAIAVTRLSYAESSPELLAKAQRYGAEAARLNPNLAEVHRALSGLFYAQGDLERSREEAEEALEIAGPQDGPLLSLAWTARLLGRPDRALRWHRLAMQLEDHPADFEFSYADCLVDLGRDEEARQIYERVSALHPDLPEGWVGLCRLRLLAGDSEAARKIYQANQESFAQFPFGLQMAAEVEFFSRNWPAAEKFYRQLAATDPDGGVEFYGQVAYPSALGRLRQLAGAPAEAAAILEPALGRQTTRLQSAPQNPRFLYRVAALEATLGQTSAALPHLRAAAERGQLDYRSLRQDPRFDALRGQPEFNRICDAMAARVAALRAKTADRSPTGSAGEHKDE